MAKTINKKFNSLNELSMFINSASPCGFFENRILSSEMGTKDFTGTENLDEANNLMLGGWSAGAKRVKSYMTTAAGASAPKRQIYNSVVGFTPNVPKYLVGHPLNMINQRKIKTPKKVITIVYNCAVSSDVKSKDIEESATRLFNVISGLESSGVRVDLWIVSFARKNSENLNMAVKIKSAGQPFNLLKMVYPVVHPSFERRQMFAVTERAGVTDSRWACYGSCVPVNEFAKCCKSLGLPSDNIFSYYQLAGRSESDIIKMIK